MSPAKSSARPDSSPVIVVVEAEVLIRMVICDYLRECGYRVIEAASAAEALLVLQQNDLSVDAVLSDVEMPGAMDGFALARWVRLHRPGLDVVLVGSPDRAAAAAADLCEQGPLLAKPYHPQAVVDRIRRLLAERPPRSP
jgi:CheY-like chemotaxis protein